MLFQLVSLGFCSPAPTLVYYHAGWCHHSQEFMPIFDELEEMYKRKHSQVKFVKFDCTANVRECERLKIQGYPTIVLELNDEKRVIFRLPKRTVKVLSQWIDKQLEVNGVSQ